MQFATYAPVRTGSTANCACTNWGLCFFMVLDRKEKSRIRCREWYWKNKQRVLDYQKSYSQRNRSRISVQRKVYRILHIEQKRLKDKEWRLNNVEKKRRLDKEYRIKNLERISKQRREQYWDNPEKYRARARESCKSEEYKRKRREYYQRYKQYAADKIKEWRIRFKKSENGLINSRANCHRRREKIKNNDDGTITPSALRQLLEKQNRKCNICGGDVMPHGHLDHIFPISKGGAHTISNVQWLCPTCNMKKGSKLPE